MATRIATQTSGVWVLAWRREANAHVAANQDFHTERFGRVKVDVVER
jgi:hypothetical protein